MHVASANGVFQSAYQKFAPPELLGAEVGAFGIIARQAPDICEP